MSDDEILEKRCKEQEVEYQIAKELKAEIFPLLDEAHRRKGYRFDKTFSEQNKGMALRLMNSEIIMLLLRKLNQSFSIEEEKIIRLHLEFIALFEGYFATQINFLTFALIANDHNLMWRGKAVETLNDIEKVSLSSKLDFLKRHGFKELITDKVDTKLRNSVAHLFYDISKSDVITVGGETISEAEYNKRYDDFRNIAYSLWLITRIYYSKFASFPLAKLEEIKCSCGYVNKVPVDRTHYVFEPLECSKCKKVLNLHK